jgi:chromosome segregation ATPase
MEIIGQIIGFLFAYYLLRLAFKLFGKNRVSAAVLVAWASVFILICSLPWFQTWAKSFIASNITAKLTIFDQQVNAVQKATTAMQGQLGGLQADINKHQQESGEVKAKILSVETNVNTVQEITSEMQGQLTNQQATLDKYEQELAGVQTKIQKAEAGAFDQNSVVTNQFQQITRMQAQLAGVAASLSAQEKQLLEVKSWVNKLFGKAAGDISSIQSTNN